MRRNWRRSCEIAFSGGGVPVLSETRRHCCGGARPRRAGCLSYAALARQHQNRLVRELSRNGLCRCDNPVDACSYHAAVECATVRCRSRRRRSSTPRRPSDRAGYSPGRLGCPGAFVWLARASSVLYSAKGCIQQWFSLVRSGGALSQGGGAIIRYLKRVYGMHDVSSGAHPEDTVSE
jgi:hypothetical protein